jgi:hypothetical protein
LWFTTQPKPIIKVLITRLARELNLSLIPNVHLINHFENPDELDEIVRLLLLRGKFPVINCTVNEALFRRFWCEQNGFVEIFYNPILKDIENPNFEPLLEYPVVDNKYCFEMKHDPFEDLSFYCKQIETIINQEHVILR